MAAIALREVRVGPGQRDGGKALLDISSLDWAAGELVAVIGPADAGKSLLLALLTGAVRPERGRVLIAGRELGASAPAADRIGWHDHRAVLFDHLDVRQHLMLASRAGAADPASPGNRSERIEALLELFGLGDRARRPAWQLAALDRLRLSLARLLLGSGRDVILLDEPFAGLDAGAESSLTAALVDAQRLTGQTLVLASRSAPTLLSVADRLLLLDAGRVEATGPLPALLADPPRLAVARLTATMADHRLTVSFDAGQLCLGGRIVTEALPDRLEAWLGAQQASRPQASLQLRIAPEHVGVVQPGEAGSIAATIDTAEDQGQRVVFVLRIGSERLSAWLPPEAFAFTLLARHQARRVPEDPAIAVGLVIFNRHCQFYLGEDRL